MSRYIDAADAMIAVNRCAELYQSEYDAIEEAFANLPTADVVPVVHGRWETCAKTFKPYLICSNCESMNGANIKFNFCQNCGAKMDLQVEQEVKHHDRRPF